MESSDEGVAGSRTPSIGRGWILLAVLAAALLLAGIAQLTWALIVGSYGRAALGAVDVIFWYWIGAGALRRSGWSRSGIQ